MVLRWKSPFLFQSLRLLPRPLFELEPAILRIVVSVSLASIDFEARVASDLICFALIYTLHFFRPRPVWEGWVSRASQLRLTWCVAG